METQSTLFIIKGRSQIPTNSADGSTRNNPDFASPWTEKKNSNLFVLKTSLCLSSLGLCGRKDVSGNSQPLSHQPPPASSHQNHKLYLFTSLAPVCLLASSRTIPSNVLTDAGTTDASERKSMEFIPLTDLQTNKTKTLESTPPTCIFLVCLTSLGVLNFFRRAQGSLSDSMVEGHFCYIWFDMRWRKQGSWRV
jgi:hypothetical protein